MKARKVSDNFFNKKAKEVAPALLGSFLIREVGGKKIKAKIVETEAYCGEKDLACHASKGRTGRTEIMYQKAGTIYVYLCYGMHYMLNIVVSKKDDPEAVLIRGIEIDGEKIHGPGRVTKALNINKKLNGKKLGPKDGLWLEKGETLKHQKTARIGVHYTGPIWSKRLLRFVEE
ncbi:DNA-3-methyladenine glycosylase [Candidatus Nomurabacteria bacterium]|nr:DNA-3-methyladenine glycosylase [Candidatus Nomurabacteria bacterium]